ncbi:hypothetical protein, partial [Fischerella thermalis]|uniref:hypothetical protein n=1 Tax=Fischerella thermalis TaxID=372787 RepID=UPI001CA473C4
QLPITNYQPTRQYKYSSEHDIKSKIPQQTIISRPDTKIHKIHPAPLRLCVRLKANQPDEILSP